MIFVIWISRGAAPGIRPLLVLHPVRSWADLEHPVDGASGLSRHNRFDLHRVLKALQRSKYLRQSNLFHMRAERARSNEVKLRKLYGDVVAHRAFGYQNHLLWLSLTNMADHSRSGPYEIGFRKYLG